MFVLAQKFKQAHAIQCIPLPNGRREVVLMHRTINNRQERTHNTHNTHNIHTGTADLCCFFRSFFCLPPQRWHAFLSRSNTTRQLVQAMIFMFVAAPARIKLALVWGTLSSPCGLLRGSLLRYVCMGVLAPPGPSTQVLAYFGGTRKPDD